MELPWHFYRKSNNHIWMHVFLSSRFCPLTYMLILRQNHTVLITAASVKLEVFQLCYSLLKIFKCSGPLHFHINLGINLSTSTKKKSTAIFIGIELYVRINLWRIYISTILKLPIHKHGISLYWPHKNELWTISTNFSSERIHIRLVFFIP